MNTCLGDRKRSREVQREKKERYYGSIPSLDNLARLTLRG